MGKQIAELGGRCEGCAAAHYEIGCRRDGRVNGEGTMAVVVDEEKRTTTVGFKKSSAPS